MILVYGEGNDRHLRNAIIGESARSIMKLVISRTYLVRSWFGEFQTCVRKRVYGRWDDGNDIVR